MEAEMSDEMQPGMWHVAWAGAGQPAVIKDSANNIIATIYPTSERKSLSRAGLIASAPALFDSLVGALEVFRAIAEHAAEPANLAAQDMIPVLESALDAANLLGPIAEEDLTG